MKEQNILSLNEKVAITQLTKEFTNDLIKHSYFFSAQQRGDVLNHGFRYVILQAIKLIPRATRLVAYHTKKKIAIGFLYLEQNTDKLFTIEYVFVHPNYRKMGLAKRLFKFALILAKKNGASRVNLNVDANSTKIIDFYRKMGFEIIGRTLLVQGYLSGSTSYRLIKRVLMGQGFLTKLALKRKNRFYEVKTNLRENREALFNIYQHSMEQKWVEFFQINANNVINGSRHVWQPPFFRDVLINDSANCFAIIFNSPLSSKTTVELYNTSEANIPSILNEILKILLNRGTSFTQITFFNPRKLLPFKFFEEKGMMTFKFVSMGKIL